MFLMSFVKSKSKNLCVRKKKAFYVLAIFTISVASAASIDLPVYLVCIPWRTGSLTLTLRVLKCWEHFQSKPAP